MLLIKNRNIKRKFISNFWFRYLLLSYNYLYFFFFNKNYDLNILSKEFILKGISFKFFYKMPYFFSKNIFFNSLGYNSLVIYSNSFLLDIPTSNISLLSIVYKSFFVNNSFLFNINNYYRFFNNNYLFIKGYFSYFIFIFYSLMLNIYLTLNYIICSLKSKL